jgi:predicted dienelactone hydrolase
MAAGFEPVGYTPFDDGPFRVSTRSFEAADAERDLSFPCTLWHPADVDGRSAWSGLPLVVFSHASNTGRNSATYLCSHLASHGYVVAAMDHSEGASSCRAWTWRQFQAEARDPAADAHFRVGQGRADALPGS